MEREPSVEEGSEAWLFGVVGVAKAGKEGLLGLQALVDDGEEVTRGGWPDREVVADDEDMVDVVAVGLHRVWGTLSVDTVPDVWSKN